MTLLHTEKLTKIFGGLTAVNDVNFEVAKGEVHALIGPNGAGKSTFVGLVSGRIPATDGAVWFEGENVSKLPAHARIKLGMAYTFQITAIYAKLSLYDNVALALGQWDRDAAADALDKVGLRDRIDQIAGDLAYGHQRLLEIAMGVAQSPRLLILDEPTQGLAESEIADFNNLINGLRATTTILLIEHNMDVVMGLADRITVLDMGMILATGTPDEIRANQRVQDAYLGTSHAET
ncbi:MAG: ABC transporter ATP-binding protein [Aliishimia sp.]